MEMRCEVRIHAVAERVINEVPLASGEFLVPKEFLDIRRAVALEKSAHDFERALSNIHVLFSV
jgi:hypothetical protein